MESIHGKGATGDSPPTPTKRGSIVGQIVVAGIKLSENVLSFEIAVRVHPRPIYGKVPAITANFRV